jgi:hypothetical protein
LAPEIISDPEMVSRLLFEPSMRREDAEIFWENVFQFPSAAGSCESLIWRKYAVAIADVHGLGCEKQKADRKKGRDQSTYFGAITGNVGDIKAIRSAGGIGFTIVHVPDEGIFHAHVAFSPGSKKNDRSELKVLLRSKFGRLESHKCDS